MKRTLSLLLLLSLALAPMAWAARPKTKGPTAGDQPVHVVADKLEVMNRKKIAIFTGKVRAVQGDVTMTSDKLLVYYERGEEKQKAGAGGAARGLMDQGAKVHKIVATGHVKIVQQNRVAVGRKATYWAGGRKILLEGRATVWRGQNQVSGETITVFLDEDRTVVHGAPGKRVTVTIVPGGVKGAAGAKKPAKAPKPRTRRKRQP